MLHAACPLITKFSGEIFYGKCFVQSRVLQLRMAHNKRIFNFKIECINLFFFWRVCAAWVCVVDNDFDSIFVTKKKWKCSYKSVTIFSCSSIENGLARIRFKCGNCRPPATMVTRSITARVLTIVIKKWDVYASIFMTQFQFIERKRAHIRSTVCSSVCLRPHKR